MQLSVLIRNLNEADQLYQTLLGLKRQQVDFEYETVVVDNESDDNSVQIATSMGARVITLKRKEFTFGHALNYGIERCDGEYILILSAHVILLNEFFLQDIPQCFNDADVVGLRFIDVCSGGVKESLQKAPPKLFFSDSPGFVMDNWKNFIVNHCAALRRSCWEKQPFDEKAFASEDKIWSIEILKQGFSIRYNVPGFYVYTKPFSRKAKIKRMIIEESAKKIITGKYSPAFEGAYTRSMVKNLSWGIQRMLTDVKIHRQVFRGIQAYMKNAVDPNYPNSEW